MGKYGGIPTSYKALAAIGAAVALVFGVVIGHEVDIDTDLMEQMGEHIFAERIREIFREMHQGPFLGKSGVPKNIISDMNPKLTKLMRKQISPKKLRENVKSFSRMPHVAGLWGSQEIADEIAQQWRDYGLDLVEQKTYNILLSYPDEDNPNLIKLFEGDELQYTSAENEIIPGESNSGVIQPYNAFSPNGEVKGSMVYVNYCRREDFKTLVDMGVQIAGHIVICRYGAIFRGSKVTNAEEYDATGVILFSDPKDYAAEGVNNVYPNSWWLPKTGVQRGSVYDSNGDPLTPGYPSIKSAYRLPEESAEGLPEIPCHPIGYQDAEPFLRALGGPDAPESWQGGLDFTYKIGPLKTNMNIEMTVNNKLRRVNESNVIGYIRGSVEPDRYVLVGGHRDAWVFGSVDPSTGTAVASEIARIMGKFKKYGWRPRRTIVFVSWGAEEFGLIGSTEWVEEFANKLSNRAVAYLNLDTVVVGNHSLLMSGLPILNSLSREAAKAVETANEVGKSMYQEWLEHDPDPYDPTRPRISNAPGAGSDHAPFYIFAGVPVSQFIYAYNWKYWRIQQYPVYHSAMETFDLFEKFVDPEFKHMQAMTGYILEMVVRLSDSHVIPYDVQAYGDAIIQAQDGFERIHGSLLEGNVDLDDFKAAAQSFQQACGTFINRLAGANRYNPLEIRAYNDVMMGIERSFLDAQGLPGRPLIRHVIFAPSSADRYAGSAFPGLTDALYKIEDDPDQDGRWDAFKRHLASVTFLIESAANNLKEFYQF